MSLKLIGNNWKLKKKNIIGRFNNGIAGLSMIVKLDPHLIQFLPNQNQYFAN